MTYESQEKLLSEAEEIERGHDCGVYQFMRGVDREDCRKPLTISEEGKLVYRDLA